MTKNLLCIGYGFSARALTQVLHPLGWSISGTTRSMARAEDMLTQQVTPILWPGEDLHTALTEASHLLISAAPSAEGDPLLNAVDLTRVLGFRVFDLDLALVILKHDALAVREHIGS